MNRRDFLGRPTCRAGGWARSASSATTTTGPAGRALDARPWGDYRGWVLAGHTHGGQCRPPFLPAPIAPVRNRRYAAGEVALADGRRLYVNRGLGFYLPVRFNVRPEVTAFTLRRG